MYADVSGLSIFAQAMRYVQSIEDRVAQHLDIISKTFQTNQNLNFCPWALGFSISTNPGTPGTKMKAFRNNFKMLCHLICNWLYNA